MSELLPVVFDAPPVNPAPIGLYAATIWPPDGEVPRWFGDGLQVRPFNYGGGHGVWDAHWLAAESDLTEDDVKTGERPDILGDFKPEVLYGYDDTRAWSGSQEEADSRAAQNLRLNEQTDYETAFATRMITDATALSVDGSGTDVADAVGQLEAALGKTGTVGLIHASPRLAAKAAEAQLIVRNGGTLLTPLGHRWVFGGGYDDGLALKVVATSQTFGLRTAPTTRGNITINGRKFAAVAERSVVIGYETVVGLVDLD